ncbi:MAG: hypothetical protein KC800_28545, partial [Candidatus Eremiobacteraeota bacterium]|nr:hypothetical protein [Candidatus Eremiobacteraeota bacterium]
AAEDSRVPEREHALLQPFVHVDFIRNKGCCDVEKLKVVDTPLRDAFPGIDEVQEILGSEIAATEKKRCIENQYRDQKKERNQSAL